MYLCELYFRREIKLLHNNILTKKIVAHHPSLASRTNRTHSRTHTHTHTHSSRLLDPPISCEKINTAKREIERERERKREQTQVHSE